ncbi:MAG: hypothetical protein F2667_07915 [Actinobacteria bacterium]|uniref:Unannotated protein n=1 Tax=freshwater metagenome TaxID=449393 RepID=A0A6J6QLW6_9ZZZZ|nr:hypothetical protein [Actinomycetota bacterium]
MSSQVVVYALTALAAVVVLLTRVRLGRGGGGRHDLGGVLLGAHTVVGTLSVVLWVVFIAAGDDSALGGPLAGIIALAGWWTLSVLGLLILARWLPSKGRHAVDEVDDAWSAGPALSWLAHLGMVVGVGVFTWAYLTHVV